jgi:hypothetical protein
MKTLTIAFPAKFQIHARFAMTLMEVVDTLRKCQTTWDIKTHYILGKSNLSHARSVIVTEWYETAKSEDGFFFIDTDHTFTAEDVLRVVGLEGDLNAGIYCNRNRDPTCFPLEGRFTDLAENIPLKYAATGFLFFQKKALDVIHSWMKTNEGLDRVIISDFKDHIESRTIPFFHAVIEPPRESDGKRFWLGEDFSFSYRAFQAGLKIRGCVSYTLGHDIPYVVFNDKPRRGPQEWIPIVVGIYCGCVEPSESLLNQCRVLSARGFHIVIYSLKVGNEYTILMKRYEEFHAEDTMETCILWGSSTIPVLDSIKNVRKKYLMLDTIETSFPLSIHKIEKLITSTEELKAYYSGLMPPEKLTAKLLQDIL